MQLLAPAAAIIAGTIALPALIVLYLLKLRRRPVRVSTGMFWQQAEHDLQVNVPLRWIRPSALLLLHVLIVSSLVLALGRPALRGGGDSGERVVLLVDCSASMSATDMEAGATRLAEAKKRAVASINDLTRIGASVCVVSFAREARVLSAMTTSRRVLLDAVDAVQATDQPANLPAALALVESIARPTGESGEGGTPASTVLFSDGGFSSTGELVARGVRVRFEHVGPSQGDTAKAGAVEGAPHRNVGIVVVAARRNADDPGTVRMFARVINADARESSLAVTLSLDGRVLERRAVTVPARGSGGPGELPIAFEFLSPRGGLVMVSLGVEDALKADNEAALVLQPPVQPAILLAHRTSSANDPKREARATALALLRDALVELRPRTLRVVDEAQIGRVFASGEWRAYDLFIGLDAVPPASMPLPSITFGAVPRLAGLTGEEPAEDPERRVVDEPEVVLQWDRQHPLLRSIPLDSLLIARSSMLRVAPSSEHGERVSVLARGRSGPIIALQEAGEARHVVFAFALEDSNWPLQVSFPLFLANAVDYLTLRGESGIGHSFSTGETVVVPVPTGVFGTKLTYEGPIKVEGDLGQALEGKLTLGVIPRAGVYVATGVRDQPPLAVNLVDATESSLVERSTLEVGIGTPATIGDTSPREVWPWFVLAAAALLVVEWVVYGSLMKV